MHKAFARKFIHAALDCQQGDVEAAAEFTVLRQRITAPGAAACDHFLDLFADLARQRVGGLEDKVFHDASLNPLLQLFHLL